MAERKEAVDRDRDRQVSRSGRSGTSRGAERSGPRFLYRVAAGAISSLAVASLAGCSQPYGMSSSGDPLSSPNVGMQSGMPGGGMPGSGIASNGMGFSSNRSVNGSQSSSGLSLRPTGRWGVEVQPGVALIAGQQVKIPQPVQLTVTPAPEIKIQNEPVILGDDPPRSFSHGARLKGLISDVTTLPGALDPTSVQVFSASSGARTQYREGKDYLLDHHWGELSRNPRGKIGKNQTVYVDYSVRQMRLDLVQAHPDGTVTLKPGVPVKTAPAAPAPDAGCTAVATVFVDYGAEQIGPDDIFPVGAASPAPSEEERRTMAAAVAHTRAKLQAGDKVTVVFWGDSVTAGGAATGANRAFPELVGAALRSEFPKASVDVVNAGVGGSNIAQRLTALDKDVIAHHPDLVVVEFVNDMGLPRSEVKKDYTAAVKQLKAAGSEVILTTPHFTMPEWMKMRSLRGQDPRPDVAVIREVALAEKVGLADVSRRWEHLASEGIPYVALLYNGINHPDDRGHEIYAQTIDQFFTQPAVTADASIPMPGRTTRPNG
jgi:hypothetical protein